jgi:WD40 repeat protein
VQYRRKHRAPTALCLVAVILGCGDDATEPQTGNIWASLTIDGTAPDADGCLVSVDGSNAQHLLDGERHLFVGLSAGSHTVAVSEVASNCTVVDGVSRAVIVSPNATASVLFAVDCQPPPALQVATQTAGSTIEQDGYEIVIDGTITRAIGLSDVETFEDITLGLYEVELTGLAGSCRVIGDNPVIVDIVEGAVTTVDFGVACPPFFDHIAFTYDGIYVMEVEGSTPVNVTRHLEPESRAYLDWSPDGTRLAYRVYGTNGYDIEVLRVDGSDPVTIDLPPVFCVHSLEWTPDGTRIGFAGGGENHDVWVVEADGSNLMNLTNSAAEEMDATWSPDGNQILFTGSGLYVMDADGSNPTLLQERAGGTDLHWSPDGSRIVYVGKCETDAIFQQVCVMDPDGANPVSLTDPPADDWSPDWSPDGTRIAFAGRRAETGIFVMNADGSDVLFLVEGGQPAWSPSQ